MMTRTKTIVTTLTITGLLVVAVGVGVFLLRRCLRTYEQGQFLKFEIRPNSPLSQMRFTELKQVGLPQSMKRVGLGGITLRLPESWNVTTGERLIDCGRVTWLRAVVPERASDQTFQVRIFVPVPPKLPATSKRVPWWRPAGYGQCAKPLYHSARKFFSPYPTELSFILAMAESPDAAPLAGSPVSVRRRALLLFLKPSLGGFDVYGLETAKLYAIISVGVSHGARSRGRGINSHPMTGVDCFRVGLRLFDSAGRLRISYVVVKITGCRRRKALYTLRMILSGMSFAGPG